MKIVVLPLWGAACIATWCISASIFPEWSLEESMTCILIFLAGVWGMLRKP